MEPRTRTLRFSSGRSKYFYIEEIRDPRAAMEKASTTIITVSNGTANSKQIEEEFRHTSASKVWRWFARKLAGNKFSMRFPDAKMVQVYNNFKCLGMKNCRGSDQS